MKKAELVPTANQTFELSGRGEYDFVSTLERSYRLQAENRIEEACNVRYSAVQRLMELLPDDEEVILEFGHRNSRAALELVSASAVDHFLIGDFEMSAALCELLLELDPEDHLECIALEGFCYVALGEYELFGEIAGDIADSAPEKQILKLWSAFRQSGELPENEMRTLRERFSALFDEFTADSHPVDDGYLTDSQSERPSRRASARRLWLQTEHLWAQFPDFIAALRNA